MKQGLSHVRLHTHLEMHPPFHQCRARVTLIVFLRQVKRNKAVKKAVGRKIPACPECGGKSVIPVVHGPVTPSVQRSIDAGRAIRADREEWEGMTQWYCKTCGCDWSAHWRRFKKRAASTPLA